jgi:hypothetical protein
VKDIINIAEGEIKGENDIINMLVFMIDSIHVMLGGLVLQQRVGIPMGSNCAPLLANLLFYSYEADFIQEKKNKICPFLAQGICIYADHWFS